MNVSVTDSNRLIVRRHDEMNFWFLAKYSIEQSKKTKKRKDAFLMNAAVMSVATLECWLSNLVEYYLSYNTWVKKINKSNLKSVERWALAVEYLTGQKVERTADEGFAGRKIGVKKVDISDLFDSEEWDSLNVLMGIRNNIIHRRTESTKYFSDEGIIKNPRPRATIDLYKVERSFADFEDLLLRLKGLFEQSIVDQLDGRLNSFFVFLKQSNDCK